MRAEEEPRSATCDPVHLEAPARHPFCRHLRTKKMYYGVQESQDEILASRTSQTFWCEHTMTDTGPDDGYVEHARCRPGRGCYEALRAG